MARKKQPDALAFPEHEHLRKGTRVMTPDGSGVTVGFNMRKNTNGGPGCGQYVVQLDDGRIRHYQRSHVIRHVPGDASPWSA